MVLMRDSINTLAFTLDKPGASPANDLLAIAGGADDFGPDHASN